MALALGVSLSSFEQSDDDLIHGDDSIHFSEPDLLRDKVSG